MKPHMTIVNLAEFQGALKRIGNAARCDALGRAAMAGGFGIEGYAKINANEQFSAAATNNLAGSIQTVLDKASGTSAEVSVGPSVVYGRIQELGGWIKPVSKKFLHFFIDGVEVFTKSVYIPPRPYLRPAADEHHDDIVKGVKASLAADIAKAAR